MAEHWDLTGWEATAAADLVRLIEARLPDVWIRHEDTPGQWTWELDDEDNTGHWVVVVNGLPDRILVPVHGWPAKVGPTVLAGTWHDTFVSVTLPNMTDRSDLRNALRVLSQVVPALGEVDHG